MRVVPFRAEHLDGLDLQEAQRDLRGTFGDADYAEALQAASTAFSAIDETGKVLCCAGVHEIWPGRGIAWALIDRSAGKHFRFIHRAVAGFLAQCPIRRVEMLVAVGFAAGHRWAKMLGMTSEGVMRAYSPDGDDYMIYARVRP